MERSDIRDGGQTAMSLRVSLRSPGLRISVRLSPLMVRRRDSERQIMPIGCGFPLRLLHGVLPAIFAIMPAVPGAS
jgi:hypothetical protein